MGAVNNGEGGGPKEGGRGDWGGGVGRSARQSRSAAGSSLPLHIVIDERENRLLQRSGFSRSFWALIRGSRTPPGAPGRGGSDPLRSSLFFPISDGLRNELVVDEAAGLAARCRFGSGSPSAGTPVLYRGAPGGVGGRGSRCPPPGWPVTHRGAAGVSGMAKAAPPPPSLAPLIFPQDAAREEK